MTPYSGVLTPVLFTKKFDAMRHFYATTMSLAPFGAWNRGAHDRGVYYRVGTNGGSLEIFDGDAAHPKGPLELCFGNAAPFEKKSDPEGNTLRGMACKAAAEEAAQLEFAVRPACKNREESVVFYRDVLGLLPTGSASAKMQAAAPALLLLCPRGKTGLVFDSVPAAAAQPAYYLLEVRGVDGLCRKIRRLQKTCIASEPRDMPFGVRKFDVRDPGGNVIGLYEEKGRGNEIAQAEAPDCGGGDDRAGNPRHRGTVD